jgi:hypothetical protein
MNFEHEFETIEILVNSNLETRGIDAFTLALIKTERQIRKLFTFLIYQHPNYSTKDIYKLRDILAKNRNMYFDNFIKGIDLIYSKTIKEVYGKDFDNHLKKLIEYKSDRNKIFHGQLTNKYLDREELLERIEIIKYWSKTLATKYSSEIGYDGFGRNSFQKSHTKISFRNQDEFSDFSRYSKLLKSIDNSKK